MNHIFRNRKHAHRRARRFASKWDALEQRQLLSRTPALVSSMSTSDTQFREANNQMTASLAAIGRHAPVKAYSVRLMSDLVAIERLALYRPSTEALAGLRNSLANANFRAFASNLESTLSQTGVPDSLSIRTLGVLRSMISSRKVTRGDSLLVLSGVATILEASGSSSETYTLTIVNDSSDTWNFVFYPSQMSGLPPGTSTLAWVVVPIAAGAEGIFTWSYSLDFYFKTYLSNPAQQQISPANTSQENAVTLLYDTNSGAYSFLYGHESSTSSLKITPSIDVPSNYVDVGIGIDSRPAFSVLAKPNYTETFTPATTPTYMLSFGSGLSAGEPLPLDLNAKTLVQFPQSLNSVTVTLDQSNTWESPVYSQQFVASAD
jgi:hypothetical protein